MTATLLLVAARRHSCWLMGRSVPSFLPRFFCAAVGGTSAASDWLFFRPVFCTPQRCS